MNPFIQNFINVDSDCVIVESTCFYISFAFFQKYQNKKQTIEQTIEQATERPDYNRLSTRHAFVTKEDHFLNKVIGKNPLLKTLNVNAKVSILHARKLVANRSSSFYNTRTLSGDMIELTNPDELIYNYLLYCIEYLKFMRYIFDDKSDDSLNQLKMIGLSREYCYQVALRDWPSDFHKQLLKFNLLWNFPFSKDIAKDKIFNI